jgi:two-component system, NarL family, sensor histidine kinase UhpB
MTCLRMSAKLDSRSALHVAADDLYRVSERYRVVVEQSPDAIWLAENGVLQLVNPACVSLLGAAGERDLLGQPLQRFAAGEPWPQPQPGEPAVRVERRLRRLDDSERAVELSIAAVPDHGGTAVQGVMRDITERQAAELALRRTQAALQEAQRIARLGYFSLDLATGGWTVSDYTLELIGQPPGTRFALGDEQRLIHPEDRERLQRHLEAVLAGGTSFDIEYRIVRAVDGEVRWLHGLGHTQRDANGRVSHLFASAQDVTERRLATDALERQREELRRLSASLSRAREAERRHVARELHDEFGQRLSVIKLELARASESPAAGRAEAEARRLALIDAVDDAMTATRRIAADLRPTMLDDLGLEAAVDWQVQDWARRTGLAASLRCDAIDDHLSGTAATAVYRIVQEALTNVMRHAHARQVQVSLACEGSDLVVSIEDDGVGLAPGAESKRGSSGLVNIRERARDLGGAAVIRNRPSGGCRLDVRLPLDRLDTESPEPEIPR